jgi:putative transposase
VAIRSAAGKIVASVGSGGDSCNNAWTETISGMYQAKVIQQRSWQSRQAAELAALIWARAGSITGGRCCRTMVNISPVDAVAAYYA